MKEHFAPSLLSIAVLMSRLRHYFVSHFPCKSELGSNFADSRRSFGQYSSLADKRPWSLLLFYVISLFFGTLNIVCSEYGKERGPFALEVSAARGTRLRNCIGQLVDGIEDFTSGRGHVQTRIECSEH